MDAKRLLKIIEIAEQKEKLESEVSDIAYEIRKYSAPPDSDADVIKAEMRAERTVFWKALRKNFVVGFVLWVIGLLLQIAMYCTFEKVSVLFIVENMWEFLMVYKWDLGLFPGGVTLFFVTINIIGHRQKVQELNYQFESYQENLAEFEENNYRLPDLEKQYEEMQSEYLKIKKQFEKECAAFEIPDRRSAYLKRFYKYSIENYPDKSTAYCLERFEAMLERQRQLREQAELAAEREAERREELEAKRERLEEEREKREKRERSIWGNDGEPDLFETYTGIGSNGNYLLRYRNTDAFGNLTFEDENGCEVTARSDSSGNIRRTDNGQILNKW